MRTGERKRPRAYSQKRGDAREADSERGGKILLVGWMMDSAVSKKDGFPNTWKTSRVLVFDPPVSTGGEV